MKKNDKIKKLPRIMISLKPEHYEAIKKDAIERRVSVSLVGRELIEKQLENK